MNEFLAGSTAAIISRLAIAPIDTIKIRTQLSPPSTSIISILQSLLAKEGVSALWKGNLSALSLYIVYGGFQFYFLSLAKPCIVKSFPIINNKNVLDGISGGLAASLATFISFPFDTLRTHFASLTTTPSTSYVLSNNTSLFRYYGKYQSAVHMIYERDGLRGFYKGIVPSIGQIYLQMGMIFYTYSLLNSWSKDTRFINGAIAGLIGKTIALPLDVTRKRMQVKKDSIFYKDGYDSMLKSMAMIRKEGYKGMFRGFTATCLKSSIASAVTFYSYEQVHRIISNSNP